MQAGKRSFAHVFYCSLIRSSRGALTTVKLAIVGMAHHNRSLTLFTLAAYRPSLPAKIIRIGSDRSCCMTTFHYSAARPAPAGVYSQRLISESCPVPIVRGLQLRRGRHNSVDLSPLYLAVSLQSSRLFLPLSQKSSSQMCLSLSEDFEFRVIILVPPH